MDTVYEKDLQHATQILKNAGCSHVFLFGSLASDRAHDQSDLDLAIRGCPQGQFFQLAGRLYMELDTIVDLIDLDNKQDPFVRRLTASAEMIPLV